MRVDLAPGSAKEKDIGLVGYWFFKGRDPIADKRACKPCANGELNKTVTELATALLDAAGLDKAHIRITTPPGLVVMLDGTDIGVTPIEADVTPGDHTVALVRDGKELGKTTTTVDVGDNHEVKVPITAGEVPDTVVTTKPPPDHIDKPPPVSAATRVEHPSRVIPGVLMATGIGAIAVGRACSSTTGRRTAPTIRSMYPNATKEGAIIAGAGGVALITGLVWWLHSSSTTNGPTASVGSGGTMIGWMGRF